MTALTRGLRVCNEPGCPTLTANGKCPRHLAQARQRSDQHRPTPAARGYDHKWRATRQAFLARYPDCADCGSPATDVHHIDGKGPNGPHGHDWANLEPLCHSCHSKRTTQDQPAGWNT